MRYGVVVMVTLVERVEVGGDGRGRGHLLVLTLLLLDGLHVGGRRPLGVDELRRCATDERCLTAMLSHLVWVHIRQAK